MKHAWITKIYLSYKVSVNNCVCIIWYSKLFEIFIYHVVKLNVIVFFCFVLFFFVIYVWFAYYKRSEYFHSVYCVFFYATNINYRILCILSYKQLLIFSSCYKTCWHFCLSKVRFALFFSEFAYILIMEAILIFF